DQVTLRLIDERLSTTSAQRQARESGKKLNKQEIDQWAAVAILEAAIEEEKIGGELAGEAL
ncbi:MAG: Holliday junction resolvase RuvX, partial [Actinobacteria bacterium]|nr:Holliday junction resolvase RuvX [Actinomycetota bacterium]